MPSSASSLLHVTFFQRSRGRRGSPVRSTQLYGGALQNHSQLEIPTEAAEQITLTEKWKLLEST